MFEVELKFPVPDSTSLEAAVARLQGRPGKCETQVDEYYNHPARDFAVTDEALRIRSVGGLSRITYKGPKIDRQTKTRREIELPLGDAPNTPQAWHELLTALGFRAVLAVRKERRTWQVQFQGHAVEVALDRVAELGTFAELELMVDEAELSAAKACLQLLAEQLGLRGSERRSYLEMLLERR